MQKISVCIGFNNQAEEAVNFYKSVFKDVHIHAKTICGEDEFGGPPGSVRTISFDMLGQKYMAVNGGPHFTFTDGLSLMVICDTQDEIDQYWEKLSSNGGQEIVCGWVKDKFGMSWQVVPTIMDKMMSDPDQKKSQRVMQAVLKMKKLDIEKLKQAYEE